MKTRQYITLISAALTLGSAASRGDTPIGATQAGDVVYTLNLSDPTATLTNDIYFVNGTFGGSFANGDSGTTTGGFPDVSFGVPNIDVIDNPVDLVVSSFGLLGIDNILSGGGATGTLSQSVFVAFSNGSTLPAGTNFDTFFAPFFAEHTDLLADESTIVAALQDPDMLDSDTTDESGRIIYQFRDYVIGLSNSDPATAAPIDTGTLTLYHFSDATPIGESHRRADGHLCRARTGHLGAARRGWPRGRRGPAPPDPPDGIRIAVRQAGAPLLSPVLRRAATSRCTSSSWSRRRPGSSTANDSPVLACS